MSMAALLLTNGLSRTKPAFWYDPFDLAQSIRTGGHFPEEHLKRAVVGTIALVAANLITRALTGPDQAFRFRAS